MRRRWEVKLVAAILLAIPALASRPGGGSTTVRVLDPSGAAMAGAVLLVNPRYDIDSLAVITDAQGRATLPALGCRICVITAIDPRRLFLSTTTEFEGGAPSVTLVMPVRPTENRIDLAAIHVSLRVSDHDGKLLRNRTVVVRNKVETMENNWFSVLTIDSSGRISLELDPGEYVVASPVRGKFLEAPLHLAVGVMRKCSQREGDCLSAYAARRVSKMAVDVRLAARDDITRR